MEVRSVEFFGSVQNLEENQLLGLTWILISRRTFSLFGSEIVDKCYRQKEYIGLSDNRGRLVDYHCFNAFFTYRGLKGAGVGEGMGIASRIGILKSQ